MLVLSRKRNQFIHIGPDVRVYVTRIKGARVHIGVEAPERLVVSRGGSGDAPVLDRQRRKELRR